MDAITVNAPGSRDVKMTLEESTGHVTRWRLESEGKVVKVVALSCRCWQKESLDPVVEFINEQADSIEEALLDDIIASLDTDLGLGVTDRLASAFLNSDLKVVILKDNAMGPRGLSRVGGLFTNSHLRVLDLNTCGLGEESMTLLADYFKADDGRILKCIEKLVLDNNMIGVEGAQIVGTEILPHCAQLKFFSYQATRPLKAGSMYIAKGLRDLAQNSETPRIEHLGMADCTLGTGDDAEEDPLVPFVQALENFSSLSYLNINEGELEDEGISSLVDAIKTSGAHLDHLLMDACGPISSDGATTLAEFVASQKDTLKTLHLNINELADEGVAAILEAFAEGNNVLADLALDANEIEADGAQALVDANLPHLTRLSLKDNEDLPQNDIRQKYGPIAFFSEEEEHLSKNATAPEPALPTEQGGDGLDMNALVGKMENLDTK